MFEAFFILGLTIIVGYVALFIADRYKISQVILLMLFGFVLGPLTGVVDTGEGSLMRAIYPFMAVLALIILLFDGGLSFNIFNVFKALTKSTIFTFLVFLLNMLFALIIVPITGLRIIEALMLGAVLGGTSSAIVIAMAEKTGASQETKSLLTIESTLTDSLVIIFVFILIQAMGTLDFSLGSFANSLLSTFSISIILGTVGAFGWNFALQRLTKYGLDYMLTVAALFILYSLTEAVEANGALAVFVFGLVFGNMKNIPSSFFSVSKYRMDEKIKDFQSEVTFFTRTFFFAYIGMLFPLQSITSDTVAVSVLLTSLLIVARYLGDRFVLRGDETYERELIIPMLPRGLAAAVVVGILISNGVFIPHMEEVVFMVIFLTNIIATFAVYAYHNGKKHEPAVPEEGEEKEEKKPEKEAHESERKGKGGVARH